MTCIFILFTVSFKEQTFLILKSNLSNFFFLMDGTFGVITKRYLPNMKSQRFSLMFFSKCFKVLHIFLWSILNFFGMWCKVQYVLKFIFKYMEFKLFQNHLLKKLPFSIELLLYLCLKLIDQIRVSLFLESVFCFTDLFVYLDASTTRS